MGEFDWGRDGGRERDLVPYLPVTPTSGKG